MEIGKIITRKELVKEVQAVLDLPSQKVRLNGIGTLRKEVRPARECRVPGTDRTVEVPAKFGFKIASKSFPVA